MIQASQDVNEENALEEIKEILIKHLLPNNYNDFLDEKNNAQISKSDMKDRQRKKKTELTLCDMNSLQDYDHYIDLLNIIKTSDESAQRYYLAKEDFLSFMQKFPLVLNYSACILLMYLSLKQLARLNDDVFYS